MPSTSLNGVNLRSLGVIVERTEGLLDAPPRTVQTASALGTLGDVALTTVYRPRLLTLIGTLLGSTYADRVAKQDPIKALAAGKLSRITVDDGTNVRTITGYLLDGPLTPIGTAMRSRAAAMRWTFLCPHGAWLDVTPTLRHVTAPTAPHNCPVGTAPSRPVIEVMGGATTPEVQVKTAGGELMYRLRFTNTLTSAQSLEIDCAAGRIWHWSSGTRTNGIGYLNVADRADFARLALDPQHGDLASGPTVTVTTGTARVWYWKAWL